MSRNANKNFAKPMLEELEERTQPSFLILGAVQMYLEPPLQNKVTDMQVAKVDLQTQFTLLSKVQTPPLTVAQAETAYAKGSADYQRMLNDQQSISSTVASDIQFISGAAFSELVGGDPVDVLLLVYGPLGGFDPIGDLNSYQTQANSIINGNDVQTWVHTSFNTTSPLSTSNTFAAATQTPS